MDYDFWKKQYQHSWEDSSRREKILMEYLRHQTGRWVEETGLGAGSTEFIHGNAQSNGHRRGEADLHVCGTNIYVEVTGPLKDDVAADKPLWFRPDKIDDAMRKIDEQDTFFAHHCPSEDLWRVIHVDREFLHRCLSKEFEMAYCTIRGAAERYVEIPADDRSIKTLDELVRYIREYR